MIGLLKETIPPRVEKVWIESPSRSFDLANFVVEMVLVVKVITTSGVAPASAITADFIA
jgi:hypothetical protein